LEVAKERVPWVSLFTDEPEECAVQSLVDEWPAEVFSVTDEDVVLDR
jgi:hypothetical protein